MATSFDFRISDVEAENIEPILETSGQETDEVSEYFKRFEELLVSLSELDTIKSECSQENWDCSDELPVTEETIQIARKFLFKVAKLDSNIPLPSLTPTSMGGIEIEWYKKRGYRFVLRLNSQGVFIYSGLLGIEKDGNGKEIEKDTHGKEVFDDKTFPKVIESNLSLLFNI